TDGTATTSCDQEVAIDGTIIEWGGHMHELGQSFRLTLNPGMPGETILLDIDAWDFDWQGRYQPVEPVPVQPGDVLRIECTWDRSLRADADDGYIVFGEGTEDEMCLNSVTIRPNAG
ncbi:MAG: hypothetical protein AAGK32_19415, partial [Actinomycetota bacterium]